MIARDEPSLKTVAIDTSASGALELIAAATVTAAGTNRRVRVVGWFIKVDGATDLTFEDTDGTDLSGPMPFGSGDGGPANAEIVGTYAKGLQLNVGTSGVQVAGYVTYYLSF